MDWSCKQHPVEIIVEWASPMPLAFAAGWSATRFGLSPVEASALGAMVLAAGFAAIKAAGKAPAVEQAEFEPVGLEALEGSELGELLLEAKDEVLILDDPLVKPCGDSRVVRLFEQGDPTPGELVDRIEGFLGAVRQREPTPALPTEQRPVDASAAFHAALANIRASLR